MFGHYDFALFIVTLYGMPTINIYDEGEKMVYKDFFRRMQPTRTDTPKDHNVNLLMTHIMGWWYI